MPFPIIPLVLGLVSVGAAVFGGGSDEEQNQSQSLAQEDQNAQQDAQIQQIQYDIGKIKNEVQSQATRNKRQSTSILILFALSFALSMWLAIKTILKR